MLGRNMFIDPRTGDEYLWQINHDEEDGTGRERPVESSQNVAGTRTIQTQGDLTPLKLRYSGSILTQAQLDAFWDWFHRCETQTIWFRDVADDEYEVTISSFIPKRVRVASNSRQLDKPWKWTYTIEMTVVKVRSGSMAGQPA